MKRIGFHAGAGVLVIVGNGSFPARSLMLSDAEGGRFQIWSLAGRAEQLVDWDEVATLDGGTFASHGAARAYLETEFARTSSHDIPTVTAASARDLPAGMPLAVSRATGALEIARADTYALAFVAGLAADDIAAGFAGAATRNALTLPDWSAVTGATALAVGQPYFLGTTGGLTLLPPSEPGQCSVRVGAATGAQTFAPIDAHPILL